MTGGSSDARACSRTVAAAQPHRKIQWWHSRRGLAAGADGLELDVRLSRDGVVVVHHDNLLDRTTNLAGPVSQHSADELGRADAAYHFGPDRSFPFRGRGIGVPDACRCSHSLSRRSCHHRSEGQHVGDGARCSRRGARDGRGRPRVLRRVRAPRLARNPASGAGGGHQCLARGGPPRSVSDVVPLAGRAIRRIPATRFPKTRDPLASCPRVSSSTRIARSLGVQVWTVDTADDATRLLGWGVDALITDNPLLVVPICKNRR